ncbi:MAG: acyltransferase [Promethearchaeota archaeon]
MKRKIEDAGVERAGVGREFPNYGEAGLLSIGLMFCVEVEVGAFFGMAFVWGYFKFFSMRFWGFLPFNAGRLLPWIFAPLAVLCALFAIVLGAAVTARLLLSLLGKPLEGEFPADYKSHVRDYRNWVRRGGARRVPLWMFYLLPFWETQRVLLKLLGQNRIGKGVVISEKCHVDPELVEIGDRSFIGLGATVLSHSIDGDTIEIARVRIGKGVLVGAHALVNCGAEIGDGAIIAGGSVVRKHQKIPPGMVYGGNPCVEIRERDARDDGPAGQQRPTTD